MRILQFLASLPTSLYPSPSIHAQPLLSSNVSKLLTPINCLSPPPATFLELIDCFDGYTVPANTYRTPSEYNFAQPDEIVERPAWNAAVDALLAVNGNCGPDLLPHPLLNTYTITLYHEAVSTPPEPGPSPRSFCILSEVQAIGTRYRRGWGLVAVPATRALVSRYLHISAPHPKYDLHTPQHAATVFRNTGAKSLLISGRHRNAYSSPSLCVEDPDYSVTDPTHDIVRRFHL